MTEAERLGAQARIKLLESRGRDNGAIVRKLRRKLLKSNKVNKNDIS